MVFVGLWLCLWKVEEITYLSRNFNLNAKNTIILKPVNWFAAQINWLVSVWRQHENSFFMSTAAWQNHILRVSQFKLIWVSIPLYINVLRYPNIHLLVQSQRWEHQENVWNLFKVNNKDTRTTSMTSFWCLYDWFCTDFINCSGVSLDEID